MSNYTLIKHGMVLSSRGFNREDILIENERVIDIGLNITQNHAKIIDASNLIVSPGGIDVHTHLELQTMNTVSSDTFLTGSAAALWGGTTTIIDFANQIRGEGLEHTLLKSLKQADNRCFCDYSFHVAVTDVNKNTLAELNKLVHEYGVTSFKSFLAYDALMLSEDELFSLMSNVAKLGGIVTVHAETGAVIKKLISENVSKNNLAPIFHKLSHTSSAEIDAALTAIKLGEQAGCSTYIVHVSTEGAANHIREAKNRGALVYGETCPQYLFLNDSLYDNDSEACKYIMSPPLRTKQNNSALWQAVSDKTLDVIATDHCPFFLEQKLSKIGNFSQVPNGAPGIENRVPLIISEALKQTHINLQDFLYTCCINPAKIFGLYPKKGDLLIGGDADLLLINPNKPQVLSSASHHMNVDYSCYEGTSVQASLEAVMLRGKFAISDNKFVETNPKGQYLKRNSPKID